MSRQGSWGIVAAAATACSGGSGGDGGLFDSAGGTAAVTTDGDDGDGDGDDGSAGDDGATGQVDDDGEDADDTAGDDSGPKLDVGSQLDVGMACEGPDCDGCTYVDLLFVIDNSVSMGDYQNALALAFPAFAATLVEVLPPGTNVHVGVTSTEMGYSSGGSNTTINGSCSFIGDGNQPNTAFYVTPDDINTERNGAQGRLYQPAGLPAYFSFDTDDAASLPDLEAWFAAAATIGEGGSQIEMSAAPVGWFADPVNEPTNAGFLRDAGAVLVVFFMQDEPDQTPMTIDGQPGGAWVLDRVADAKATCGGLACVVAGGFLNANACSADGNLPLDDFLAGVEAPAVQALPDEDLAEDDPQAAADEMNQLLGQTLAEIISQTCEEIEPEG